MVEADADTERPEVRDEETVLLPPLRPRVHTGAVLFQLQTDPLGARGVLWCDLCQAVSSKVTVNTELSPGRKCVPVNKYPAQVMISDPKNNPSIWVLCPLFYSGENRFRGLCVEPRTAGAVQVRQLAALHSARMHAAERAARADWGCRSVLSRRCTRRHRAERVASSEGRAAAAPHCPVLLPQRAF